MPKVSIIVPVHNPGKYLTPLLNSLINQTFQDIEILLIDDGSTDGSRQILKDYKSRDERIKVIFRRKDSHERFGQKYSADLGRLLAQGTYIMLIDHDDELTLDAIEKLYNATDNETIDIVQGRNISINEKGKIVYRTPDLWPTKTIITDINKLEEKELYLHLTDAPVAVWTCLIRKDFQKDLELADCIFNDTDFIWKLKLTAKSFCYLPEYIYEYHEHDNSASGKKNTGQNAFDIFESFNYLEKFLKEHSASKKMWILYTIYKFRMAYGHSGGIDPSLDRYQEFMNRLQKEMKREINVAEYIKKLFYLEHYKAYMELIS